MTRPIIDYLQLPASSNDGQNNSIESSTQQQQSTQYNFGMMDNNNMNMDHDQVSIPLFVIDIWNI